MDLSRLPFIQKHLYSLVHLRGLLRGGFGITHYGQWGEDTVLGHLFAKQKTGFYVDVGAYHPMHYSNTYLLYKKGWRGVAVDANPESARLFNRYRKGDTIINSGISSEVSTKTYYIFNHQSCNTFSREQRDLMLKKSFIKLLREIPVACAPLQTLISRHAPGKQIDLLNVDVEGMNLEALKSLNFERTAPKVICVEDDDLDLTLEQPFGSDIHTFLAGRSYALVARVGHSSIYSRL